MADIQTLLNQSLQNTAPSTEAAPTVSDIVRSNVAAAAEANKAKLGGQPATQEQQPDFYQIAAGRGNQRGAATMDPVETDLRSMSPNQIMQKYGPEIGRDLLAGLARGTGDYVRDRSTIRDFDEAVGDSLVGAGSAFVGGIAGLGALGVGLVNDDAGAYLAKGIDGAQEWLNENRTSKGLQAARRANQALTQLSSRDSKAQYEADIAAGGSSANAKLRRIGRDFMSALEVGASDATTLVQGTAEGVGSLIGGGVVARGLRSIGTAAVGGAARNRAITVAAEIDKASGTISAARAARMASGATWPLSVGLQEGGGAYVGTASEIMNMKISDLEKSPVFQARVAELQEQGLSKSDAQKQAQSQIAGEAGLTAAAVQTPFATATGFLTRGLERPAHVPTMRGIALNAGVMEPTEELLQSGVGQVAQNIGIQQAADPTRDLSEGVGEQAALGALYGMTSAGVIQSPSAAVIGGKRAYAGTSKLITKAIEAGKPAVAAYMDRAERIREQQAKAPTVPTATMAAEAADLSANAEANAQVMQSAVAELGVDAERQVSAEDFISSLGQSVILSENDPVRTEIPEELSSIFSGDTDRFQAALKMAQHTEQQPEGTGRLMAAAALQVLIQPMLDLQRADSSELDSLPADHPARKLWDKYSRFLSNVDNTPEIKSALKAVAEIQANTVEQVAGTITDDTINTPQGQLAAQAVMSVAEVNPLAVPKAAAQIVLKHAGEGRVRMSESQRQALNMSMALLDAQQQLHARADKLGLQPTDVVARQVLSDSDPIAKGAKNLKLSAAQQTAEILKYLRAGNIPAAAAQLADFGMFVQHMQNKVEAVNQSFAPGKNHGKRVPYQALSTKGKTRSWYTSDGDKGAWVNTNNEKSLTVTKNMGLEAETLATIFNGLVEAFPQLQVDPVKAIPMNPELLNFSLGSQPAVEPEPQQQKSEPEQPKEVKKAPVQESVEEDTRAVPTEILEEAAESLDTDTVSGDLARTQIQEELADRQEPVQEKQKAEPKETKPAPQEAPVEVAEPARPTGLALVFPNLLNAGKSLFYSAYTFAKGETPPSRLLTLDEDETPFSAIRKALDTREGLIKFLGKTPKRHLSDDTANAYQKLLATPSKADAILSSIRTLTKQVSELEKVANPSAEQARSLKETRAELTKKRKLLLNVGGVAANMRSQLRAYLLDNGIQERLDKGDSPFRWRTGKALNIVDENMQFDQNLLEGAVLAGMQWLISSRQSESFLDEDDIESLTGIRGGVRNDLADRLSQGFSAAQVKRMIASKIKNYWGLRDKSNADKAYTEGITEAVAANLINAFEDLGLINVDTIRLTEADGLPPLENGKPNAKTIDRYVVDLSSLDQHIFGFPTAIENAVLTEPEEVRFFGDEKPPVARKQLNNPMVDNTRNQRRALSNEQDTVHKLNMPVIHLFRAFGKEGMRLAFGAGEWAGRTMNKNFAVSVDGQNRNVLAAYDTLMETLAEAESYALSNNIPLSEVSMRFGYNMTRTGRMQMLGKYNAQSNKQMREAITPTWSTLDLANNAVHQTNFYLALAQALGVKPDKLGVDGAVKEVQDRLAGRLAPAVELIEEWLSETSSAVDGDFNTLLEDGTQYFPVQNLLKAFNDAGVGFSAQGLHALVEYARFRQNPADTAFTTSLYLEADGKTNGLANALVMLTGGQYDAQWFQNVQKIGLNFGEAKSIDQLDKVDLYQEGTKKTTEAIDTMMGFISRQKNRKYVMENVTAVNTLLAQLFPDGVMTDAQGKMSITRDIMKNPMTIFTYGSSAYGIAGNIVGDISHAVYERFSRAADALERDSNITLAEAMFPDAADPDQQMRDFVKSMNTLMNSRVYTVRNEQTGLPVYNVTDDTYNVPKDKQRKKRFLDADTSLTDFTFDRAEIKNLTDNILNVFVNPMTAGIEAVVGENLTGVLKDIRRATQVQSIFMEHAYIAAINEKLAEKRKADPSRHANDFLSAKDLQEIDAQMLEQFPLVQTDDQVFLVAKSRALEGKNFQYGNAFNDGVPSPAYVYTPANAGVSGIPYTVIGFGDGLMMQLLAQDTGIKNTLKIFDGMNMPLDKVQDYSRAANGAVYETWKRNPVRAIELAYSDFLEKNSKTELSQEMIDDLSRALFDNMDIEPTAAAVMLAMQGLRDSVSRSAMQIEARHRAMEELNLSVDQMTAAASPFATTDKSNLEGTEALAALQEAYTRHLAEIVEKQANPVLKGHLTEPAVKPDAAFENVGRVDAASGARTLPWASVKKLGRLAKMTPGQREVFDQVLEVAQAMSDEISVIYGTPEQIRSYQISRGLSDVVDPVTTDKGFITTGDKTRIYLMNPHAETLVHELIHAVTFNTVLQYYQGKQLGKDTLIVGAAVRRLEVMMADFLGSKVDRSLPYLVQHTIERVQSVINNELSLAGQDPAVAKAKALNEFMAWSLSNPQLMKALGAKKVNPIVALATKVIDAIKDMIWRGKKMAAVGEDVLSNILFNTGIIMNAQPSLAAMDESVRMAHAGTMRPDLKSVRDMLHTKVVEHLKQTQQVGDVAAQIKQTNAIALQSAKITDLTRTLSMHFNLSPIEASTLHSVVSALGTEISLDPNALSRVQDLYVHVQKNLNISHFIDENAADPAVESTLATEKFDLIMGRDRRYKDPLGRTTMLPAFLGLAMVSEDFRSILEGMSLPKSDKLPGNTVDTRLRNLGSSLMDSLSVRLSGEGKAANVRDAIDALTNRIYENLVDEQSQLEQIGTGADNIYQAANDYMVAGMNALSSAGVIAGDKIAKNAMNPVSRTTGNLLKIVSSLASETESEKVAEGVLAMGARADLDNTLMNIIKDFVGRTSVTAKVYDMIKSVRSQVQQIRQQFREKTPQIINSKFKKAPTKEQYASMFRVLAKTDLAVLAEFSNTDDVLNMLTDDAKRDDMVTTLEDTIRQADPVHFKKLQDKMKQLAHYMNTGIYGKNLLSNAYAISQLWGEGAAPGRTMDDRTIAAIDRLTTLYALQSVSKKDRASIASLVQSEREGISFVLDYLRGQRKDELKKVQSGVARANHYKGNTPSLQDDKGHMVVDYEANEKDLLARGYVRVAPYLGSTLSPNQEKRNYYYSKISGRAPFSQGIMQNVKMTAYGVDEGTGLTTGQTAGRITDKKMLGLLRNRLQSEKAGRENLRPIYDMSGKLIAVEETLDPTQMARLNPSEQLHEMLGVWRGRQVEERMARAVNYQLVNNLFDQYNKDQKENQGANADLYVNLFDYKNRDAVEMDALSLMPDYIQEYIESKFGKGRFMVRKDQVEDVIGYRNATIGDFWTNNNRLSPQTNKVIRDALSVFLGKDAYTKVIRSEQILQGFVSDIRTLIVVKSVVVPAINFVSNVFQLLSRGVSPLMIAKGMPSKLSEINNYVKSHLRQIELEAELRAVGDDALREKRLRAEIRSITDMHRRLSIWPLIEAGEFSTIADVGMTPEDLELSSGKVGTWLERQVDKLPESLRTPARYGLIARDTALFQGLQRSVQYGDFLAKAVLYDHLTKNKKQSKAEALGRITEEYVNYERLPGRGRAALENAGLLWFYNFKLRITKIALSTLRNNPLMALTTMALPMPSGAGLPVDDNVIAKLLQGTLGYSVGPEMAIRAPSLMPWYNLVH